MQTIWTLTKRNIKLYTRNRSLIFLSMLTILVIIALNVIFLQKMNVDNLMSLLPISEQKATLLISSLTFAGILFTSTITVPLAVMDTMIEDEAKKRMIAFTTSPISKLQLTLGYSLAAFLMGCIVSFLTLILSQAYLLFLGGSLLSLDTMLKLIGLIVITVFSSSTMVFFLTTWTRTPGSFSVLNTILGTLIGFIAGIYLPLGMLPDLVQQILKFFPGLYAASFMRELFTTSLLEELFTGAPANALVQYQDFMGISLHWGNTQVLPLHQLLILLGSGILFVIASAYVLSRRKSTDR
ncbi:MAG: ABC transporter permease [Cellulosilyticaceae bacterium]